MIPNTPDEIRLWIARMGVSYAQGATALGLGNADTVMREYVSGRREPARTTRMHMDLLEKVRAAHISLVVGDPKRARELLDRAMAERNLLGPEEIDTTPMERT